MAEGWKFRATKAFRGSGDMALCAWELAYAEKSEINGSFAAYS